MGEIESLRQKLQEILKEQLEIWEQMYGKFEDFNYSNFICREDNRDDIWYTATLYARINLLRELLNLIQVK